MKLSTKLLGVLAFGIIFTFSGCHKATTEPTTDQNTQTTTDNALIDGEFTTIFNYVNAQGDKTSSSIAERKEAGIEGGGSKSDQLPDCANVTIDTISNPKTILIDLGTTNCLCKDGFNRRGKILISFSGKWKTIGSSINVSLSNYYVEDMPVTGSKTISINSAYSFTISVQNASITTLDGKKISWNATRTITQTRGMLTPLITLDDQFEIRGNASGINRDGVGFSVIINDNNPLIKSNACTLKDFISGILSISNSNGATLTVNYDPDGSNGCNKNAVVTVNGKVYAIKLR